MIKLYQTVIFVLFNFNYNYVKLLYGLAIVWHSKRTIIQMLFSLYTLFRNSILKKESPVNFCFVLIARLRGIVHVLYCMVPRTSRICYCREPPFIFLHSLNGPLALQRCVSIVIHWAIHWHLTNQNNYPFAYSSITYGGNTQYSGLSIF